jgi:tRNA(Ile)-lysidine synthase TilS/MesJ
MTTFALDRNFLRHQVLPMIEARWPGYRSGISRTAQIMGSVDDASTDALVSVSIWLSKLGR